MEACDVYVGTSAVPGIGMGVFAARRFLPGDTVVMSPLFLRFNESMNKLKATVLLDYMHGHGGFDVMPLGLNAVINHGTRQNVVWTLLTRRHTYAEFPWKQELIFMLHYAIKEIQPGEEIFAHFGLNWLQERGLEERTKGHSKWYDPLWNRYGARCSKMAAGIGHESMQRMMELGGQFQRPSTIFGDSGWGAANALVDVAAGMEIESAPALLLPLSNLRGSTLGPLVFEWQHLNTTQKSLLRILHDQQKLHMYMRKIPLSSPTMHMNARDDVWNEQNVALLPLGAIAMVRRVGRESTQANCELWLRPATSHECRGCAGVEMTLVATRYVPNGQALLLGLPLAGYVDEHLALMKELVDTGQPTPFVFQGAKRNQNPPGTTREGQELLSSLTNWTIHPSNLSYLSECALQRKLKIPQQGRTSSFSVPTSLRVLLAAKNSVALLFVRSHCEECKQLASQLIDIYETAIDAGSDLHVLVVTRAARVGDFPSSWWHVRGDCANRFAKLFEMNFVPGVRIIAPDFTITHVFSDARELRFFPDAVAALERKRSWRKDAQVEEEITREIR